MNPRFDQLFLNLLELRFGLRGKPYLFSGKKNLLLFLHIGVHGVERLEKLALELA